MLAARFPQVDSALVRAVIDKLRSSENIGAQEHWKVFDVEHSRQTRVEDDVYSKGLLDTFTQINSAAQSLATNVHVPVALKVAGSETPHSGRTNISGPGGCFHFQSLKIPLQDYHILKLGPDQTQWADIVCPMEFKKTGDKITRYDTRCRV
ncbi:hypothetical protein BS47DRAFT_1343446 [Hydnum rufescens UP504]|uniref:Uncharacterized protein n=1 Tax=Hydnum rufescens UP504 TaxID=1448309 RepID=A0A9P6DXQ7_9AGAM|nr:hypothetical protein BS47DRAFT_1343446 [Hydnum rufescens UP504]